MPIIALPAPSWRERADELAERIQRLCGTCLSGVARALIATELELVAGSASATVVEAIERLERR